MVGAISCAGVEDVGDLGRIGRVRSRLEGSLDIREQTETVFAGTYTLGDDSLDFLGAWNDPEVQGTMRFSSGTRIDLLYVGAGEDTTLTFQVSDGKFNEGDRELLGAFNATLADIFPYGTLPGTVTADTALPQEGLIRNYAGYFSESPLTMPMGGYEEVVITKVELFQAGLLPPNGYVDPPSYCTIDPPDNDGVAMLWSCCWNNPAVDWDHDRHDSCLFTRTERCGAPGDLQTACAGRCGPGCFSSPFYTQDCLDHDFCVDVEGGSVFPDNPDCGDEWWEAADDFAVLWTVTFGPVVGGNPGNLFLYGVCF